MNDQYNFDQDRYLLLKFKLWNQHCWTDVIMNHDSVVFLEAMVPFT